MSNRPSSLKGWGWLLWGMGGGSYGGMGGGSYGGMGGGSYGGMGVAPMGEWGGGKQMGKQKGVLLIIVHVNVQIRYYMCLLSWSLM